MVSVKKRTTDPIWQLNETLKSLRKEKVRLVRKYIKVKIDFDLSRSVQAKKEDFVLLNRALKEKNLTLLDEKIHQVNFDLVLKALPIWTTTTKEISKCLPLSIRLFDLVIFDESSQCDIATAIPAIFRAKQMVVVGDPLQLRHISFLSRGKQRELKQKNSVTRDIPDYRNDSLIDWTNETLSNPDQSTYLDEHFRSKTDIINFSNSKFYGNRLKLIRSNPLSDTTTSVEVINVDGTRDSNGVNLIEIDNLISKVREIIDKYKKANVTLVPSIGISSPFADQVKQIKKELSEAIPFDLIKRHDILVGTPFHFQGEERDIMMISFCIDNDSHHASINYLNREDVFNVLITRARNRQIVFTSVNSYLLPYQSLLKEYLEVNMNVSSLVSNREESIYDLFFQEVSEYLKKSGFNLILHSTVVSGVLIDLVVLFEGKCYCVDLIGYPGQFEEQFSLEDLRLLNHIDIPLYFLPYSSWYLNNEQAKMDLIDFVTISDTNKIKLKN